MMSNVEYTDLGTHNVTGSAKDWLRSHWKAFYHAKEFASYFPGNYVPCKI